MFLIDHVVSFIRLFNNDSQPARDTPGGRAARCRGKQGAYQGILSRDVHLKVLQINGLRICLGKLSHFNLLPQWQMGQAPDRKWQPCRRRVEAALGKRATGTKRHSECRHFTD